MSWPVIGWEEGWRLAARCCQRWGQCLDQRELIVSCHSISCQFLDCIFSISTWIIDMTLSLRWNSRARDKFCIFPLKVSCYKLLSFNYVTAFTAWSLQSVSVSFADLVFVCLLGFHYPDQQMWFFWFQFLLMYFEMFTGHPFECSLRSSRLEKNKTLFFPFHWEFRINWWQ